MKVDYRAIGNRLHTFRVSRGYGPQDIAQRIGISRAAVYRIEAGEVVKLETLERLANLLETTLASLLNVGVEYYPSARAYFEHMLQLEEQADQVIAYFSPVSYLLTSDQFASYLRISILEALSDLDGSGQDAAELDRIIAILEERKQWRKQRHLSVINLIKLPDQERWPRLGIVGPSISAGGADQAAPCRAA